ncbi:carbohydrate ABC transporter substrate-binding protein, CUT1 family [Gracilibacillus ureilyticus]|uniref:Carbohydrate ABC transporter substrate-binding protein, CUT1 family n=1 Tax=Gracilibacillus ureilyticus TaxID=531814 RepID=A0A1H9NE42_9BACI|nr:extracellular solute-binding protein [Gracilibacillus ureilyticus]SER34172.1 carbohydrate ABC transporter substrate-binding protein, CUT1 family [Gracilibacillus ureilyticus]
MRKLSFIIIISFGLMLGLVACSSGESQETSGNDVIELTLWNDWTEDRPENRAYKSMVEKFNEQHDDIEVVIEAIPHDQYETKLRTQAAGQQLPDMFRVWPGARIQPLVEGDAVLPLNDITDNWKGYIPEAIMEDYAVDGNQYAIPGNVSETSLIFYNKEMVAQAGFDTFPATYEELKTLIQSLNDQDITPIALGNKGIWPLQSIYISTIADRFTGSDFLPDVLNGEGSFENEQFIKSLAVIQELTEMNAFNSDMNTLDEAQARNNFISGNTAMHFAGSWAIGPILDSVENIDNIGVAPFPSFAGGEGDPQKIAGVAGGGIALNSKLTEEEQQAAFEFLKFFYSDEMYQQLIDANIIVPADVEIGEDIPQVFQEANKLAQGGLAPVYDATLTPELTDVINNGLQSITLGEMTPEELAAQMQQELESE